MEITVFKHYVDRQQHLLTQPDPHPQVTGHATQDERLTFRLKEVSSESEETSFVNWQIRHHGMSVYFPVYVITKEGVY